MPRSYSHRQSFDSLTVHQFFELFFADGNTLFDSSARRTETSWITEEPTSTATTRRRLCFYTISNSALHSEPFRCVETQRSWFESGQDGAGGHTLVIETDIKPEIATTLFSIAAKWTVTDTAGRAQPGCLLVVDGTVACQGSFWGLGGYAEDLLAKQTTEMFESWLAAAQHRLQFPPSSPSSSTYLSPPTSFSPHISSSSSSSSSAVDQPRTRLRSRNRSASPPNAFGSSNGNGTYDDDDDQPAGSSSSTIWCRLEPPAPTFSQRLPDYVLTAFDYRHDEAHHSKSDDDNNEREETHVRLPSPSAAVGSPSSRKTKKHHHHHPQGGGLGCSCLTMMPFLWLSFIVCSAIFILYRLGQQDRLSPHRSIG